VLRERLAKTPYFAAGPPLRVRVSPTTFVLPDIVVICGKPVLTDEHHDTLTNPKVIVEILSPSTADYGQKFILYRGLASFEEYLFVAQDKPRVEVFRKTPDKRWLLTTHEGLDTVVNVESLGVSFQLAEVYDRVELPVAES
jgi:Uma2 family endonuclease